MPYESGSLIYRGGRNPSLPSAGIAAPGYQGPVNAPQPGITPELAQYLRDIGIGTDAGYAERVQANVDMASAAARAHQAQIDSVTQRANQMAASQRTMFANTLLKTQEAQQRTPFIAPKTKTQISSLLSSQISGSIANVTAETGRNPLLTRPEAQIPGALIRGEKNVGQISNQIADIGNISNARSYFNQAYKPGFAPGSEQAQNVFKETVKRYTGSEIVDVGKPRDFVPSQTPNTVMPINLKPFDYNAIASREYEIPVAVGSRGVTDMPYFKGQTVEDLYKVMFGGISVPAYSKRIWNGPAADAVRAAEALNRAVGMDRQVAEQKGELPNGLLEEENITKAKLYLDLADTMQQMQDAGENPLANELIQGFYPGVQRTAFLAEKQLNDIYKMQLEYRDKMRQAENKKPNGAAAWFAGAMQKVSENWEWLRWIPNPALGGLPTQVVLTAISAPLETVFSVPYYSYANAQLHGKSFGEAALIGLFSLASGDSLMSAIGIDVASAPHMGFIKYDEEWYQIISEVGDSSKREALKEAGKDAGGDYLHSFGENVAHRLTGNYDANFLTNPELGFLFGREAGITITALAAVNKAGVLKDLPVVGDSVQNANNWVLSRNVSGPIDLIASYVFDPTSYTPLIEAKFAQPLEMGAKTAITAAERAAAREAAIAITEETIDYGASSTSRLSSVMDWIASKATKVTPEGAEAGVAARRLMIEEGTNPHVSGWLNDARRVIAKNGDDVVKLKKALPDVAEDTIIKIGKAAENFSDFNALKYALNEGIDPTLHVSDKIISSVIKAGKIGGSTDAAFVMLKELAAEGQVPIKINLRRQFLGFVDNLTLNRGTMGAEGRVASRLAGGKNIPIYLGRSSVKPNVGNFVSKLEKWAGRINSYSFIIGSDYESKIDYVANLLTKTQGMLFGDWYSKKFPEYAAGNTDFELRFDDLLEIVNGFESDFPGIQRFLLEVRDTTVGNPQAEKILRNAETIVHMAFDGDKETSDLAKELIARLAESTYRSSDDVTEAMRVIGMRTGDKSPRRKALAKLILPGSVSAAEPYVYDELANAEERITKETSRLISVLASSDGKLSAVEASRVRAGTIYDNLVESLRSLLVGRGMAQRLWEQEDNNLVKVIEQFKAYYQNARNILDSKLKTISGEISFIELKKMARGTLDELDIAKLKQLYIEKSSTQRQLKSIDATEQGSIKSIELKRVKTKSDFKKTLSASQSYLEDFLVARIKHFGNVIENLPSVEDLKQLELNERTEWKKILFGEGDKEIKDPIERYVLAAAEVRGVDPSQIDDLFIRDYLLAVRSPETLTHPALGSFEGQMAGYARGTVEQSRRALEGSAPIIGPVKATLKDNAGNISGDVSVGLRQLYARITGLPPALEEFFRNKIGYILSSSGDIAADDALTRVAKDVELMIERRGFAELVSEELDRSSSLHQYLLALNASKAKAKGKMGLKSIGKLALSLQESVAPRVINWAYSSNEGLNIMRRMEDVERITQGYGWDSATRSQIRRRVMDMRSPTEMYDLIREIQKAWAIANGAPIDLLADIQNKSWSKKLTAFAATNPEFATNILGGNVLDKANIERGVAMISQISNQISIIAPEEATLELYRWLSKSDPSAARRMLNGVRALPGKASASAMGKLAKFTHSMWKMSVVTNLPNIAIGGIGGFVFGDPRDPSSPDFLERVKFAGIGAAIGAASGIRYIGRVAGIEERLVRYSLSRGLFPAEWIPGISRMWAQHGVELPARHLDDLVGSVKYPTKHLEYNRVLTAVGEEWIPIDQTDKHFIDAWYRIVTRQVNPSKNVLDRIVLEWFGKSGAGVNAWKKQARDWLESPEGSRELRSLTSSFGGAKDIDDILKRLDVFYSAYLSNNELRQMLLSGAELDRKFLVELLQMGKAPEVVHAIDSWIVPKTLKEVKTQWSQVTSRLILELPTTKLNRVPIARNIYGSEYRSLRRGGVAPEIAREIAEQRATKMTNKVMFQLADESRFASKADFFFPFQQPREELVRVYGSLVANNWSHTLQLGSFGARAFNNGKDSGMFYEDSMGQWTMRIPGSAWLSRVVGGPQDGFSLSVKNLFFLLQGNAFASNYSSTDFFASGPLALAAGILPAPGGPWWILTTNAAYKAYPEIFNNLEDNFPIIYNRLYPYGRSTNLLGSQSLRMFETFWGNNTPPWDLLTKEEQENSLEGLRTQVIQELLYHHIDDPNYAAFLETDEGQDEIYRNLNAMLLTWSAMQSVTPAPAKPILPGKNEFSSLVEEYTKQFGAGNVYNKVMELRPDLGAIFYQKRTTDVANSFDEWLQSSGYRATDMIRGNSRYLSADEFLQQFREARDRKQAYTEYNQVWNGFYNNPAERFVALESISKKWAESGIDFSNDYFMRRELSRIVYEVPEKNQDIELETWRKQYGISPERYMSLLKELRNFRIDPYQNARDYETIEDIVRTRSQRKGQSIEDIVSSLSPAEQAKYWQYQMASIPYINRKPLETAFSATKRADDALSQWKSYKGMLSDVYKKYSFLAGGATFKPESTLESARNNLLVKNTDMIDSISEQIGLLYDAINIAVEGKDWTTYYSLKKQKDDLSSQRLFILGELYKKFPDMVQFQDDIKMAMVLLENPDTESAQDSLRIFSERYAKMGIPFLVFDSEQKNFLKMSTEMRKNYKDSVTYRLNLDKGQIGKLYWEFLTPFQKDMLEKAGLPNTVLEKWKTAAYGAVDGGSSIKNELTYAYELMKQANKRPAGAKAPSAYEEYKLIPASNSAARSRFLKDHPEVGEWIKLGPMANMSEIDRLIVTNILVRSGKWEGDVMDDTEITNLAWARMQLKTWSKRTTAKPENYDIWLNMPSGPDKAIYLEQHPELQDWIKAGPMSNMPDSYKEVVRNIMTQYGEWSSSSDPLGEVISAFYATPASGRQKYLDAHPELQAYWKALRSPEEQRMADLTEQYFAIPDGTARKLFITAHPELQQHFIDSRTKRYENFMAKVAQYMGANPEVFTQYLNRQEALLSELISRFGTPTLVRERSTPSPKAGPSTGTSGRIRQVSRRG